MDRQPFRPQIDPRTPDREPDLDVSFHHRMPVSFRGAQPGRHLRRRGRFGACRATVDTARHGRRDTGQRLSPGHAPPFRAGIRQDAAPSPPPARLPTGRRRDDPAPQAGRLPPRSAASPRAGRRPHLSSPCRPGLPHPHHPPLGRAGDRQVKPAGKSTLAGNRKIGDKFRIRAFTGPETGMACPGFGVPPRRPGGSRNERAPGTAPTPIRLFLLPQ